MGLYSNKKKMRNTPVKSRVRLNFKFKSISEDQKTKKKQKKFRKEYMQA